MASDAVTVRPAVPADLDTIVGFIRALAEYERLTDQCHVDPPLLAEHLFGERPLAEVLIAEADGVPGGFALFFPTYSSFLSKPGIWLEDLFVLPERRGSGLGRALLGALAELAVQRGCGRLEWAVLDWNTPSIGFYVGLGAEVVDEWKICRTEGDRIALLAR